MTDTTASSPLAFVREAQEGLVDIGVFYRVRREILSNTPAGRRYVNLYDTYNRDVVSAFTANPALITETRSLIELFRPNLQALLDGQGDTVTITLTQTQAVDTYLNHLSAAASPALQQLIAAERAKTPPSQFVDKSVEDARRELTGYAVYLPMVLRSAPGGANGSW